MSRKGGNFLPTQYSLEIAESISKVLDSEFCKEETELLSKELHERYFDNISRIVTEDTASLTFYSHSMRSLSAFAGKDFVQFDQQIDFWLFTFCHLVTVIACKVIDDDEFEELIKLICDNLNIIRNPYLHEQNREQFKPHLFRHSDCLELSHAMSRAMIIFIISHEIAHISLGHSEIEHSKELEFEADELACKFYLKIIEQKYNAGMIFIHEKLLFSPVILMRFFEIFEMYRFKENDKMPLRITHPSPGERSQAIRKLLEGSSNTGAEYILKGFEVALTDIIKFKELPEVN
ncbi:MAG TPA: hypothetical protein ENI99_05205 [Sedimenticola sp.]|nr:hypothetical protein [Sedimenticola sp.]